MTSSRSKGVGFLGVSTTLLINNQLIKNMNINDAVQTIIETRNFCGNESEALRDWQNENGRLTAHQKQQVWEAVESEWSICQTEAGVTFPISNHERRQIFRSLESA